jgi:Protein of unknown function (DUF2752)
VSETVPEVGAPEARGRHLRFHAAPGAPLGAIFGGIGVAAAGTVWLLGLDHLPFTFCVFKGLTGLPCPTCGSTRALARLFGLDLAGAVAMNPFVTLVAVVMAAWALADLALLPRRRSLKVEVSPRLGGWLRAAALVAFFLNWVYLLVVGR